MSMPGQHKFIAIDEGLSSLLHVDERDPSKNWRVPINQPQARDMQLIGENKILIGHHLGWTEFEITTGRTVEEFTALEGVTAVRRQPGGNTIVAGVNLAGASGVVILELSPAGEEIRRAIFPGDYVRLIRQTDDGTYLMCCNDRIRLGSSDGNYLDEFPVEGFYHAWKAVRLANGHLIISAGYGAFMVEMDTNKKIVRKFGGKDSVPAGVNPFFYAMFQMLPNAHIILANWQGHGEGHGSNGIQLLEFDGRGEVVWSWSQPEMISSLQGVLVLDDLDLSKLHDERNGIMQPV
jgi:hypothetical protein